MKQLISTLFILLLSFLTVNTVNSLPINPYINSVLPPLNANSVVKTSDIQINFTQAMNAAFINANNIKLFGYQTGLMTASYSYNAVTKTLIINPNNNFKNGEIICLTLTSGLKTISNESITPFVYSFRTKAIGGNGIFTKIESIIADGNSINSGDLDGDGDIDLLIDDKVYKNDGNANFTFYSSLNIGGTSITADFDNDGDLDILIENLGIIYFYENNGTANFTQTYSFNGYLDVYGDLTGNGYLDITFFDALNNIEIINNQNGIFITDTLFQLTENSSLSGGYNDDLLIDDMNNDGDLDILVIRGVTGGGIGPIFPYLSRDYKLLNNNPDGSFTLNQIFNSYIEGATIVFSFRDAKTFDQDNDGFIDIISPDVTLRNNGNQTYSSISNITGGFSFSLPSDLNGDGFLDMVKSIDYYSFFPLSTLINDGMGGFTEFVSNDGKFIRGTSGDFDNDGDIDIAAFDNSLDEVSILRNGDIALPVELSSFTSEVNLNNVKLNWSTSGEHNNSGFEVHRSIVKNETPDNWIKAGFVKGTGNSNGNKSYSYEDKNLASGKYQYRLKQIDFNGNSEYFNLANEVNIGIPDKFELKQNYPNPFNPTTNLEFGISELGFVSLKVYDILGNEVAVLVNEKKEAGYYTVPFIGSKLSSGVYYYQILSGDFVETKRMLLLK